MRENPMRFGLFLLARRAFAVLGALLALFLAPSAFAQAPTQARLITVTGTGEVSAVPDQANISAGVVTQAKTAAQALADNRDAMNGVFDALRKLGVPDKSIRTSNFSIEPQYPPYDAAVTERPIIGYQVDNTVSVTLDDVAKAGPALDALVAAGANQAGSIGFSIKDSHALMAQARAEAVKDATERAETYAKAAGVTLGPVVSISEGGAEEPRPMARMAGAVEAIMAPTPIATGESTISATVTMRFEIR
jgi:uncharacterized protein